MAVSFLRAQHYVECDQCEENPAVFFCKTCPGNLCENCKKEHENRKITKAHEITAFKSDKQEEPDRLYCSDHKTKKLECFCAPCKKPVCTECILWAHNGHAVKALSTAYKEIKHELQQKKEEIENNFLPKYRELLDTEFQKRSTLTKKADEVQKEIENHTDKLIEMVKEIGQRTVRDLRCMEEEALREIDESSADLQRKIHRLQETNKMISETIETKPELFFSKPLNGILHLEEYQTFPFLPDYQLHNFRPGQMGQMISKSFGSLPYIEKIQTHKSMNAFNFGKSSQKRIGPFTIGGTPMTKGFSFGGTSATTGFSSGGTSATAGFSFGVTPTTTGLSSGVTPATTGFSFGVTPATTVFSSGGTSATTGFSPDGASASKGFSLGETSLKTGFSSGVTPATTGFSFGVTPATTGFSSGGTSGTTGFSLDGTSASRGFSLGETSSKTGFSFGVTPATTGFQLGTELPRFSIGATSSGLSGRTIPRFTFREGNLNNSGFGT